MQLILVSALLKAPFISGDLWTDSKMEEVSVPVEAFAKALRPEYTFLRWDGHVLPLGGIYRSDQLRVTDDYELIEWLGEDIEPIIRMDNFSEGGHVMFALGEQFKINYVFDNAKQEKEFIADVIHNEFEAFMPRPAGLVSSDEGRLYLGHKNTYMNGAMRMLIKMRVIQTFPPQPQ